MHLACSVICHRFLSCEFLQQALNSEFTMRKDSHHMALQGERLGRVTDKIVRGWWFKLTRTRLPNGHRIMRFIPGKKQDVNLLYEINEAVIRRCPGHFFGDYAFTFQLAFCPNSRLTCWLFRFYKVFEIMAYSCKIQENEGFQILDLRAPFCTIDDLCCDDPESSAP
jgi:hypothetical protein